MNDRTKGGKVDGSHHHAKAKELSPLLAVKVDNQLALRLDNLNQMEFQKLELYNQPFTL